MCLFFMIHSFTYWPKYITLISGPSVYSPGFLYSRFEAAIKTLYFENLSTQRRRGGIHPHLVKGKSDKSSDESSSFLARKPAKRCCVQTTALTADWHIAHGLLVHAWTIFTALVTDTVVIVSPRVLVCQCTRWQLSQIPHTCTPSPTWDTMAA